MNDKHSFRHGWREAPLADLVFFQRGFDLTKDIQKEGCVPVISSSGIQSYHSEAKVQGPGVVIGRKGSLGTVYFVKSEFWPHDTTLWSKDLKGNNPKFVYYYLLNINLKKYDVGSSNPTLNRNHIHKIPIYIPPLDIQNKISQLLEKYDFLIENNHRRIQLLEESARMLYKEWFLRLRFPGHEHVKLVDGVPEGWEKKTLGDVAATNIESYNYKNIPPKIKYVDISSVSRGRINEKKEFISADAPGRARRRVHSGDIVWSNVRPNLKAYALIYSPDELDVFSTGFTVITPQYVPFTYLYVVTTTEEFVNYLTSQTTGVSYPAVKASDFERKQILIPSKKLLSEYHERTEMLFKQIYTLESQNRKLAQARDLLLPKLMNGEVSV